MDAPVACPHFPADRDLTLQLSGSTDAQVIVAITAVSKPAAG